MANNIVEPCCCERQLPQLLREAKGQPALFQTSGDVTVEKLMHAVGRMIGDPCEMWLVAEKVDELLLRKVRYWFQRQWIVRLHLMTHDNQSKMVAAELKGLDVAYVSDKMVADGLLAFEDEQNAVVIQGSMLLTARAALTFYTGVFGRKDGEQAKALLDTVRSRMKVKLRAKSKSADKAGDKPNGSVEDGVADDVAGEVGEPSLAADLGVDVGEL